MKNSFRGFSPSVSVCRTGSRATATSSGTTRNSAPVVFARSTKPRPTEVFDTYWRFAAERQAIFLRRLTGALPPWTDDPILREYKFTNAYRASDRVSQYLIQRVIYAGDQRPEEVVFRTLLFKLFNRIETWQLLESVFADIRYEAFRVTHYDRVLSRAMHARARLYSAAYIMPAAPSEPGEYRKHRSHLRLLEHMMVGNLYARLVEAKSMRAAFELLRGYRSIGNFLAYQFIIDLNYGPVLGFDEQDFVMPGPGAQDGIRKCFRSLGDLNEADLIRYVADSQEDEFERLGISFPSLWGRPLQLIDCQNLFCEVGKYARVRHPNMVGRSGRKRIKQRFAPRQDPIRIWYPPKWGINECIPSLVRGASAPAVVALTSP